MYKTCIDVGKYQKYLMENICLIKRMSTKSLCNVWKSKGLQRHIWLYLYISNSLGKLEIKSISFAFRIAHVAYIIKFWMPQKVYWYGYNCTLDLLAIYHSCNLLCFLTDIISSNYIKIKEIGCKLSKRSIYIYIYI